LKSTTLLNSKNQNAAGIPSLLGTRVRRAILLALMLGATEAAVRAQNALPPNLMSYQGYLVDGNGTALAPTIGYDAASKIARAAHKNGTSLKEEALASGKVTEAEFDAIVRPEKMLSPNA